MAFHAETITVLRTATGAPDEDGVPTTTTTSQQVDRCTVQPTGTRESIGQNDIVTSRWLVSTTEPQDWITASDTVLWRGEPFAIDGRPQTYRSVLPHTEFVIIETKG